MNIINIIVEEYDFHDAIEKAFNLYTLHSEKYTEVDISNVEELNLHSAIVTTNIGKFYCEAFEDDEATIYMKVRSIH